MNTWGWAVLPNRAVGQGIGSELCWGNPGGASLEPPGVTQGQRRGKHGFLEENSLITKHR